MDIDKLLVEHPIIQNMVNGEEVFWLNNNVSMEAEFPFGGEDINDAETRLARFAPYIERVFPETKESKGIIESNLVEIPKMKEALEKDAEKEIQGRLFLKCDSHLPVSGSIKARGGIYEVLKFAEKVAMDRGMLTAKDNYEILAESRFKKLFSEYSVAVGSTGNLGLSIGIISAKLGFKVTVHMSSDARQWKKDLLRQKGVVVIEYPDDYQKAVAEGRKEAALDPTCHFVDDEGSQDLFLGYAVAGNRIVKQFKENNILVDENHPVFVYIPCGVGGAPGGVTFGLKEAFGKNIHCFFAEPTHAPCMTLGLISGLNDEIAVGDIGLDGKTAADGLAVGRPSKLVGSIMSTLLDGCFTINDENLFPYLAELADREDIYIEPSACASFIGPQHVINAEGYLIKNDLKDKLKNATHIIWATGGSMVPQDEMTAYYNMGK
ncbi:MAG: D-serine ammonia-lyase [Anaerovoracaceae bacterium]